MRSGVEIVAAGSRIDPDDFEEVPTAREAQDESPSERRPRCRAHDALRGEEKSKLERGRLYSNKLGKLIFLSNKETWALCSKSAL